MARPQDPATAGTSNDDGDASARSQQELYGRREPADLDEGRVGRDDDTDDDSADPGKGSDASGHPSTARSGANTL